MQWATIIKNEGVAVMSDDLALETTRENARMTASFHRECGNAHAEAQCHQLADWLEELRQKREILCDLRDKLDGVDVISERDIMRIIGV